MDMPDIPLANPERMPRQHKDPGRAGQWPGEVSDESYPHRTTGGPQRTPVARGTLAGPARPRCRPGHGRSRGLRVAERRPGHADPGSPASLAGGPDGDPRGRDGPPRAGAHVGMHPANQRGGTSDRGRPAALGPVAGRVPAGRQPPAGPGPSRNGAVTRAGGRQDLGLAPPAASAHPRPVCRPSRQARPGSSDPDVRNDVRVALGHGLAGNALEGPLIS